MSDGNVIDFLEQRLKMISNDGYDNALLSVAVAAFCVMYRNTRTRKLLMAEALGMFSALEDKEPMACAGELMNVVESLVR